MTERTPDLPQQLTANADYMAGNPPATIATDSDLWRETIRLQRAAAQSLTDSEAARDEARTALEESAVIFRAIEAPSSVENDHEADRQADRIGEVLRRVEAVLTK